MVAIYGAGMEAVAFAVGVCVGALGVAAIAFPVAKAANGSGMPNAARVVGGGGVLGWRPRPCCTRMKPFIIALGRGTIAGSVSRRRVRGPPGDVGGDDGQVVPVMRGGNGGGGGEHR